MDDSDKSGSGRIPAIPASVRARLAAAGRPPRPQTLQGLVRAGVERGVVVLLDGRGGLLAHLLGGDPAVLADGSRAEVTGVFLSDLSTTAQQGPPFQVHSAIALSPIRDGDDPARNPVARRRPGWKSGPQ